MNFELFCITMIALVLGLVITFGGYRLFLALLPLWGFFFGFGLGAQTLNYLFGYGFLASITSWVVGFIVGVIFAVLSYFFYIFGVAAMAGSVGYGLGVSLMLWIGLSQGLVTWLVGIALGMALIILTFKLSLQKFIIVIGTALIGSSVMIGTLLLGVEGLSLMRLAENPIQTMLQNSPLWAILYFVLATSGIFVQLMKTQTAEI